VKICQKRLNETPDKLLCINESCDCHKISAGNSSITKEILGEFDELNIQFSANGYQVSTFASKS
jgi:hypothetical protein